LSIRAFLSVNIQKIFELSFSELGNPELVSKDVFKRQLGAFVLMLGKSMLHNSAE